MVSLIVDTILSIAVDQSVRLWLLIYVSNEFNVAVLGYWRISHSELAYRIQRVIRRLVFRRCSSFLFQTVNAANDQQPVVFNRQPVPFTTAQFK